MELVQLFVFVVGVAVVDGGVVVDDNDDDVVVVVRQCCFCLWGIVHGCPLLMSLTPRCCAPFRWCAKNAIV